MISEPTEPSTPPDPHAWLEAVLGEAALDWVRQRNAESRIEQRAQPVAAGRELGPRAQLGAGFGVSLPYPVKCGLAQHGFEPGVGVRRR